MSIPSDTEILSLLDQLGSQAADALESQWLDFKPWTDAKDGMRVATEYAVCFGNAEGGVVVFGVSDKTLGRTAAIHGVHDYDPDLWKSRIFDNTRPNIAVELSELAVPEGTGKLLVVRCPKGGSPPYGTSRGLFQQRVGKNCMPLDQQTWLRAQISTAAVDWSGEQADGVSPNDFDPLELARARSILRSKNPESELLNASDGEFLAGIGATRFGKVTNTGLLLFGNREVLRSACPQHQVHYVHQSGEIHATRNDQWSDAMLSILERTEQVFTGPGNPEEEISMGLFKLRVPAFPLDAVREAVLNAITHRDYGDPGEVLIRHTLRDLTITSPGGFIGGITPQNILRHEPVSRNRNLANALVKLRLVESAGMGRRRIFIPALSYGKRLPEFSSDGARVTLRLFNLGYDQGMAQLVSRLQSAGVDIGLDGLLILSHLREHAFVDAGEAVALLQLERDETRRILEHMAQPGIGLLERKGHTKAATYHLTKGVAKELLGRAAYTRNRGLNPTRYAELVKEYLSDHGGITNRELRELLGLGESPSAQVEASRYLGKWAGEGGFLLAEGNGNKRRYRLRPRS